MPRIHALSIALCVLVVNLCGVTADKPTKPKLMVAPDGFPYGHDTPEGAACDLARAFINRDVALFRGTCIRLYAGGDGPPDYAKFLKATSETMKREAGKMSPSLDAPKAIGKVFASRHLSKGGPASYGYASFGFRDIVFVDVGVYLHNGQRALNRTLVIQDKDGKWYVHPAPPVSPLLSDGLNNEGPSQQDFSESYEVQR